VSTQPSPVASPSPASAHRPAAAANGASAPRNGQAGLADLTQKDALIQALTAQLEQAAEQLDRLQRSGADRRRGVAGGGLPAELVEEHRQAVGDLQRVVQQWEDMQAGLTLGRIEIQLTELRDYLVSRLDHVAPGAIVERHPGPTIHEEPAAFTNGHTGANGDASESSADSEWSRLKSQLLAGGDANTESVSAPAPLVLEPLPEPPDAVDIEHAEREYLELAILARDEYITALTRRLRAVEVAQPVSELMSLGVEAPEFVARVTTLEQQLQEHLRLAEVELSLERAKMARDHSRLLQQQEQIEKQLKKLGLQSPDGAENGRSAPASNPDRRWMRFLGTPKGE